MSILENLFKYCELWVFSRTRGWLRSPAYKYTYYPEVTQVPYVYEPSVTDTTARISWSYVQNAYSYGIEIYETNNEENYNLYTTSNNSYTITNLTPNTMYSVKVIGVNEGGDPGIASNPITFSTTSADIGTDVVINTPVFTQDNYVNGSKIGTVSCQIHNADPSADVKIEIQRTGLTSTYYMGNSGSVLYKRSNLSFVSAYQYTVRVLYIKDGDTKYSNSITIN